MGKIPYEWRGMAVPGGFLIAVKGIYSEEAGDEVREAVCQAAREGCSRFLIDLTGCPIIISPGIASLLDLALVVTDDLKGMLLLAGLNELNFKTLEMAEVIPLVSYVDTVEEGRRALAAG